MLYYTIWTLFYSVNFHTSMVIMFSHINHKPFLGAIHDSLSLLFL
ncbi:hypothetical protein MtrunA17_Chr2g0292231 [Medicago truncatula]|uniref:Transmembrane protein n=1 Tax=Medicago truncatula TaxID=3880 RepID=A0A396J8E1_MEDTR|nr:hypothetical protein MtrunA17_Chr2g0292231 [Medicago truncatula]